MIENICNTLLTENHLFQFGFELDKHDDKGGISRVHTIKDIDGDNYQIKVMFRPYEEGWLAFVCNNNTMVWLGKISYIMQVDRIWHGITGRLLDITKIK
jgi:hypothetical protein